MTRCALISLTTPAQLDVLARNSFGGNVEGEVLVNGELRNSVTFASTSCYVQQRDVLLCSATVSRPCVG